MSLWGAVMLFSKVSMVRSHSQSRDFVCLFLISGKIPAIESGMVDTTLVLWNFSIFISGLENFPAELSPLKQTVFFFMFEHTFEDFEQNQTFSGRIALATIESFERPQPAVQ